MTRRTLRIRPIALCFLLAAFALLLVPAPSDAWPSICDNCFRKDFPDGTRDAQCCLNGRCGIWTDQGYYPLISNMEWCTSWVDGNNAGCNGHQNSCVAGGGDDDAEGCTVQYGEYCPVHCMRCYYVF
jgi:hypothetical protein